MDKDQPSQSSERGGGLGSVLESLPAIFPGVRGKSTRLPLLVPEEEGQGYR